MGSIKVSKKVYKTLLKLKESGEVNMLDYNKVMVILAGRKEGETVAWLSSHKHDYMQGVMWGFQFEEEE